MASYNTNNIDTMSKILNVLSVNRDISLEVLPSRTDVNESLLQNILDFLNKFGFIMYDENTVRLSKPVRKFFNSHYTSS